MKSAPNRSRLLRYRPKLRWLKSKWILALVVGAAGSSVYAANVFATPSSGLGTTILAQSEFNSFIAKGHAFASETDTEIIAHLIQDELENHARQHGEFTDANESVAIVGQTAVGH